MFRTGKDFSRTALEAHVGRHDRMPTVELLTKATNPTNRFSLNPVEFERVLREMKRENVQICTLESDDDTTFANSSKVGGVIGSGMNCNGGYVRADYRIEYLLPLVAAVGPYMRVAEFAQDRPLIMRGSFGDYDLFGFMVPENLSNPEYGKGKDRKQQTRRGKR